jgi:hypothetical protein
MLGFLDLNLPNATKRALPPARSWREGDAGDTNL